MKSITPDRCQQELQEVGGADFAFAFGDGSASASPSSSSAATSAWCCGGFPSQFLTFEQIGLPEAIKQLIIRPRGLILVTGPTGSGKTTSLASA